MTNEKNTTLRGSGSTDTPTSGTNKPADSAGENNPAVETVKNTAKDILGSAKDSAGQAYEIAADAANSKITEQKSAFAGGLAGMASSIRQIGDDLRTGDEKNPFANLTARYGDAAAEKVDQLSDYFERKDLKGIYRDVEGFARRQPKVFIAISFAVGLLAVRFLKSGAKNSAKAAKNFGGDGKSVQVQEVNNPDDSINQAINAS